MKEFIGEQRIAQLELDHSLKEIFEKLSIGKKRKDWYTNALQDKRK